MVELSDGAMIGAELRHEHAVLRRPVERREGHGDVARGEHGGDQHAVAVEHGIGADHEPLAIDAVVGRRAAKDGHAREDERDATQHRLLAAGRRRHDKHVWPHAAHRRLDARLCAQRRLLARVLRRLAWRVRRHHRETG